MKGILVFQRFATESFSKRCWTSYSQFLILTFIHQATVIVRAEYAQAVATEILEGELKLTVNREKTHMVHASQGVKFLGVEISSTWTRIQAKKIEAFKTKVKAITRRSSPVNLEQVIADLNPILRGFANYFRMANCKGKFAELAVWYDECRDRSFTQANLSFTLT